MHQVDPTVAIEVEQLPRAGNVEVRNARGLSSGLENASTATEIVDEASGRQIAEVLHTVAVDIAELGMAVTEPKGLRRIHNSNGLRYGPVFAVRL